MTEPAKIRIQTDGTLGHVEFDGVDISNAIDGLRFEHHAGRLPRVELRPIVVELDAALHGAGKVFIPDETRQLLTQLGWTPPAEPVTTDQEPMRA
ncbi:MAG: hypothetical protein ACJ72N_06960 [Labedaea sp.]